MRRPKVSGKTVRTVSTSPFRISCSSCLNARRPGMTRIVAHGSRLCHPPGARRTRPVNNRREQIGWYFYDWANSAFPTTGVTVFLGPWLTTVTKAAAAAGGVVLLALHLALFPQAAAPPLSTDVGVRLTLASAGAWWAAFTLIPLVTLENREPARRLSRGESFLTVGFHQLRRTLGRARRYPQTVLFLVAYLLYNDGIQTVIALASQFGQEELGLPISTLTAVILMVQFVAFVGALLFNRAAGAIGTKRAIMVSLVIWTGTVTYAYGWLRTAGQFFVLGAVIAIVLGGSQALSRALYSLMIPKGQEAEYFSLYEVSEPGTSWLGPLLFGLALQFTGSYRIAILSLSVFFMLGLGLLTFVDVRRAVIEAGNEPPPPM